MSAVYRARDTLRNNSVQRNLRSQHKKAAKKQDGLLYRRTFSLHRVVCRLPGQLRHQVDQQSSRLPHRASLSFRLPGQSRSRHPSQPSGNYPVYRCVARDCRGMVNTPYRVDHRASNCYNLIASNSVLSTTSAPRLQPATHRRHDYHRQNAVTAIGDATTATSNASPPPSLPANPRPLPVRHRSHRFRQRHDRYR